MKMREQLAMQAYGVIRDITENLETRWRFIADAPEAEPYRKVAESLIKLRK